MGTCQVCTNHNCLMFYAKQYSIASKYSPDGSALLPHYFVFTKTKKAKRIFTKEKGLFKLCIP